IVATYDPTVIRSFADELYRIASRIVLMTILKYALVGAVIGAFLGSTIWNSELLGAAIVGVIAGIIGKFVGDEKAFEYKLQAQTALCQVQIEENTKPISAGHTDKKTAQNPAVNAPKAASASTSGKKGLFWAR
ncbi:MAG: hypothetical protein QF666_00975, partial [Alphaproteobacteria bacterium]|nr:hypothetical protein [Alphaproteobacteria bacterium]